MKADIMAHAGLWGWAVAGLILFAAAFVAQAIWTYAPRNRATMQRAAQMPLDDGEIATPHNDTTPGEG